MFNPHINTLTTMTTQQLDDMGQFHNLTNRTHAKFDRLFDIAYRKYIMILNTSYIFPPQGLGIGIIGPAFTYLTWLFEECNTDFQRTFGFVVTLQAQREYPPDMQCKDKFLLQSTIVAPNTDVDDLPRDTVSFFAFM